jgi:hypothetical protein
MAVDQIRQAVDAANGKNYAIALFKALFYP